MLLIDGDIVAYRSAFAAERTKYLVLSNTPEYKLFDTNKEATEYALTCDGEIWSKRIVAAVDIALAACSATLRHLSDKYPDHPNRIYLSPDTGNFREGIATYARYKGNRSAPKPLYLGQVSEYLRSCGASVTTGQEADDAIGIAATSLSDYCVASIDKDLLQIPGRHYNWVTQEEINVSFKDSKINFWTQVISGDPTDNIPGLEGYGSIKARKVVEALRSDAGVWEKVVGLYREKYGKEEGLRRAIETARLVYIRRKEGETWEPPPAL